VVAVRVNPATQASLTLKDEGSNDVISLVSTNYGTLQNQIKVKIEAGSLSGLRPTVQRGQDYFTQDNVGRQAFSVVYTGSEATATITVNGTQAVLAAPAGTTVATIAFSEYPTVQDVGGPHQRRGRLQRRGAGPQRPEGVSQRLGLRHRPRA